MLLIIDDMISSGESMIDVATELKKRKANRIFVVATFGLFTNGLEKFDKAYEDGYSSIVYNYKPNVSGCRTVSKTLLYQL